MKRSNLLRPALLAAILPMFAPTLHADTISDYRDEHRLIVVSWPPGMSPDAVGATLRRKQREIDERDLKFIDVSEGSPRMGSATRLSPGQQDLLRKDLKIARGETRPTFILIGKDGREKARRHDTLDLDAWFALIDTMPMRRAEIRDQRGQSPGRAKTGTKE
jgi:hypothetical protein